MAQVWSSLAILVFGIFSYLSVTACGEKPQTNGCGNPSGGSNITCNTETPVTPPGGQATISQPSAARSGPEAAATAPGAVVSRILGWTGGAPNQLIFFPPPDASSFAFTNPALQPQAGGPPFVFLNPTGSVPLQFKMPLLTPGMTSMKVTETVQYLNSTLGSSFTSLVTTLQNPSAAAAGSVSAVVAPRSDPTEKKAAATVNTLNLERWIDYTGVNTMTTTLCQQITDWLQSKAVFVAMRVPVTPVGGGNNSFPVPILFPNNTYGGALGLHGYQPTFQQNIVGPIPMEMRPERMTYAENKLPSASGEQWVTFGISTEPKASCPASMNYTDWSYQFRLPADLDGKGKEVPIYLCQEGLNPPPFAQSSLSALLPFAAAASTGITCLGPQTHSLVVDNQAGTIAMSPGMEWDILPPKEVQIAIHMSTNYASFIGVNFNIHSAISMTWSLCQGTYSAPNKSAPILATYLTKGNETVWLVGTVPAGTASGAYNVTLTAVKSDDAAVSASATNLLWVGSWVAPPPLYYSLFLPLIQR